MMANAAPQQTPGRGSWYNMAPSTRAELDACRDELTKSIPELRAAILSLEQAGASTWAALARAGVVPRQQHRDSKDIFDCLGMIFSFQVESVRNQREHLVLQLANAQMRLNPMRKDQLQQGLDPAAIHSVYAPLLSNYLGWCSYLGIKPNIIAPASTRLRGNGTEAAAAREQVEERQSTAYLSYCSLFLLIWGEAANVRFMPECLCYMFHHMAEDLNHVLEESPHLAQAREKVFRIPRRPLGFLETVVTPFYKIARAESPKPKVDEGKPHNRWRNYDDLNEFFWTHRAFKEIRWPPEQSAAYFVGPGEKAVREGKQGFVEQRTLLNLFTGFDRLWILLVVGLQVLCLGAWATNGGKTTPWNALASSQDAVATLFTAFITWAGMYFLSALVDILLQWRRLRFSNMALVVRVLIRLLSAAAWVVIFSIIYGMMWTQRNASQGWSGAAQSRFRAFLIAAAVFLVPQALAILLFLFPMISLPLESSNLFLFRVMASGLQEPQYVGRGLRQNLYDSIKYALFWIITLAVKFAFSYKFQVLPLVIPTQALLTSNFNYTLPVLFKIYPYFAVASLWAPILLIYFMDILIWYSLFSAGVGFLVGVASHIGEINNLKILVLRFRFLPRALRLSLLPPAQDPKKRKGLIPEKTRAGLGRFFERLGMQYGLLAVDHQKGADRRWVIPWNAMIESFREEDLISTRELGMMLVPSAQEAVTDESVWPAFLLADQITKAVSICQDWRGSSGGLWQRLSSNEFRRSAVLESYALLCHILRRVVSPDRPEGTMLEAFMVQVDAAARRATGAETRDARDHRDFCVHFQVEKGADKLLRAVIGITKLLSGPVDPDTKEDQLALVLLIQKLHEVLRRDVFSAETWLDLERSGSIPQSRDRPLYLDAVAIPPISDKAFYGAVKRLHSILTSQNALATIPHNPEARRRVTFFCNSVFMQMPAAVPVRRMRPFCVLTPYFKESVEYSPTEIQTPNEDDVSTLVYLQSVYPDEWRNLEERAGCRGKELRELEDGAVVAKWATYRGQTLARTVRGIMYYQRALELQGVLDLEWTREKELQEAEDQEEPGAQPPHSAGEGEVEMQSMARRPSEKERARQEARALARIKFTYVVSCQVFGEQQKQKTPEAESIKNLMKANPGLRIAYVDTVSAPKPPSPATPPSRQAEGHPEIDEQKVYSVLVKWDPEAQAVREIYRVQLPGPILIGEGKPENQNHAIIFTRGSAMQTIDMNQDSYLEEALKMRNFLEEFGQLDSAWGGPARGAGTPWPQLARRDIVSSEGVMGGRRRILGMREHVFTGAVSSLASFMSAQETTFVTLGQRVLANPLKVRMHYGHPDVFDRLWALPRGGISKAAKTIHVSEDIFAGFNCTLRGGSISHHEYIQVGKGRDVGLNQISLFEAKVASGNGEQVLSRDVFRLARGLDLFRCVSFYTTSVGFFFATALTALSAFAFLYGRCFLAVSGIESSINDDTELGQALISSINQQLLVQIGFLTAVPLFAELMLEQGLAQAAWHFVLMILQLAPFFFSFSMGTRSHYFIRSIMHGGAKYRSTGRGFVVHHEGFCKHFRLYSRSHFNKGAELVLLLIVYMVYSGLPATSASYWLISLSSWILAVSWMLSPFLFNPLGLDWLKCVEDWDHWMEWMWRPCGVNTEDEGHSWEAWWRGERSHLLHTGFWGLTYEFLLNLRWFAFQYFLVYQLYLANSSTSILVYVYSWAALLAVAALWTLHAFAHSRFSLQNNLTYRALGLIVLLMAGTALVLFLSFTSFTILDILVLPLVYLPTGWGIVQLATIVSAAWPRVEDSWLWRALVLPLARLYDVLFGCLVFLPLAVLSWFPGIQDMQTRVLFNQGFSRNLQIARILGVSQT